MSAVPQMCPSPCETCAKQGLSLLLTRYALMPADLNAPKLTGHLDAPEFKNVPLGETAHYGLRLLRSGYVYVYDEKREHWDEYFVTADGFMSKLPPRIRALKVQPKPATEFKCASNGAAPLAGVITIRNATHATKVWISFSDVEWTDQVFTAHRSPEHRKMHMQCITISGGKVKPQADTAPLERLEHLIAEYKLDKRTAEERFAQWCPHRYNSRQHSASGLIQAAKRANPSGGATIVALHDPVGLVTEIAALMEHRKLGFMNRDGEVVPRFAANTIANLESTIREQAKLEEIAAAESLAAQTMAQGGVANLLPSFQRTVEKIAHVSPAQLKTVADNAWKKYTHKRNGERRFDYAGSTKWLAEHNSRFREFDKTQIAPLANAHAAWLQHACTVGHMSCNYDRTNLESGAAYTAGVAAMLRSTADKQPSYDLYCRWLKEGETSAAQNLLMRALAFNQDKLLEEIKKADASPVDMRAFPSDMLVGFAKDLLEKLPSGGHAAMADLLQSVGGALFKNMDAALKGGAAARALAAVASVAGVQFSRIDVRGDRGKFVQHLMKAVMQLDPNLKVTHNQLGKAVAAQLRLMELEGFPVGAADRRQWLVILDRDAARASSASGKTGSALAAELAKSIKSVDDLPNLKAEAFKVGVAGKAYNACGSFVIGMVQTFNIVKLVNDYQNQMKHEGHEPLARLATAGFAVLGSFGEATGLALQKLHEAHSLRNAIGLKVVRRAELLRVGGRLLGLGAGMVVAWLDLSKGIEEDRLGDPSGLAGAYYWTAGIGAGLAVAFFFSSMIPLVGWLIVGVAVIVLLVLTLWIEKNKDNKVQEWLQRCHFGLNVGKFGSVEEHADELQKAFA